MSKSDHAKTNGAAQDRRIERHIDYEDRARLLKRDAQLQMRQEFLAVSIDDDAPARVMQALEEVSGVSDDDEPLLDSYSVLDRFGEWMFAEPMPEHHESESEDNVPWLEIMTYREAAETFGLAFGERLVLTF